MMECPDRELLERWATGRDEPGDDKVWAAHLDGCATCREAVDEAIGKGEEGKTVRELADWKQEHERLIPTLRSILEKDFGVAGLPDWKAFSFIESVDGRTVTGRVGRLELKEWLGAGAMGAVFRAIDPALEREVAVKVLRPEYEGHPEVAALFLDEARAAAGLHHESILPIYDVFAGSEESGAVAGYVMPYISSGTLEDRIATGEPFEAAEWLRILTRIADALAAAHETGVLHRDVKPANVLLEGNGPGVWLADFGLARAAQHGYGSGSLVGTPGYVAPEIIGGGEGSVAADLYGLGRIAAEMNFDRKKPVWAERWIASLTDPEPVCRPASAAAAAKALRSYWEDETRKGKSGRLNRIVLSGFAASLALVVVLSGIEAARGWRIGNALLRQITDRKVSIDGQLGTRSSVADALVAVPGDLTIRIDDGDALFAVPWPDLADRQVRIIGEGFVRGSIPVEKEGLIRVQGGALELVGLDLRPRGDVPSLSGFIEAKGARIVLEDCSIRKPMQGSRGAVSGGSLIYLEGNASLEAHRCQFLTDRNGKGIVATSHPGTSQSIRLSNIGFAGGGFLHIVSTDPDPVAAPGRVEVEIADSTLISSGAIRLGRNGSQAEVSIRSRDNLWQCGEVFLSVRENAAQKVREHFSFADVGSFFAVGSGHAVEWDAAPAGGERRGKGGGSPEAADWDGFWGKADGLQWVDWILQYRPSHRPVLNPDLPLEGKGGRLLEAIPGEDG